MSEDFVNKNEDKNDRGGEEESRIDILEKEINDIKKMIEDTLTDIRILINELENPFEYLSKFIDKLPEEGDLNEEKRKVEEKKVDKQTQAIPQAEKSHFHELDKNLPLEEKHPPRIVRAESNIKTRRGHFKRSITKRESTLYERALLVGDFLLKTFGKDSVHKMLHLFYRRGLITTEIYMTMLDVIENLNLEIDFSYLEKRITPEDYILALYLLNRIEDMDENEIFLILLTALKRTYPMKPGIKDLLPQLFKDMAKGEGDDKHNI